MRLNQLAYSQYSDMGLLDRVLHGHRQRFGDTGGMLRRSLLTLRNIWDALEWQPKHFVFERLPYKKRIARHPRLATRTVIRNPGRSAFAASTLQPMQQARIIGARCRGMPLMLR
jgi:hypothetical protein